MKQYVIITMPDGMVFTKQAAAGGEARRLISQLRLSYPTIKFHELLTDEFHSATPISTQEDWEQVLKIMNGWRAINSYWESISDVRYSINSSVEHFKNKGVVHFNFVK